MNKTSDPTDEPKKHTSGVGRRAMSPVIVSFPFEDARRFIMRAGGHEEGGEKDQTLYNAGGNPADQQRKNHDKGGQT